MLLEKNNIMNFIIENWLAMLGFLSAPLAWIFGGKQAKNVEIKKGTADALSSMQLVYDKYIEHDEVRSKKLETRLDFLEKHNADLQTQFNQMQLAYAKEVEQSQNWEKLHSALQREFNSLKNLYEKLKTDFDKYKKDNK